MLRTTKHTDPIINPFERLFITLRIIFWWSLGLLA